MPWRKGIFLLLVLSFSGSSWEKKMHTWLISIETAREQDWNRIVVICIKNCGLNMNWREMKIISYMNSVATSLIPRIHFVKMYIRKILSTMWNGIISALNYEATSGKQFRNNRTKALSRFDHLFLSLGDGVLYFSRRLCQLIFLDMIYTVSPCIFSHAEEYQFGSKSVAFFSIIILKIIEYDQY